MIKINKNLAVFLSLGFLLGGIVIIALQKILSTALQTGITYCQTMIKLLAFPIPYHLEILPIMIFILLLGVIVAKLTFTYIRIHLLRRTLAGNTKQNQQFSLLLKKLNLQEKTILIQSDKVFAFCFGIRKPRIYISTPLLTSSTLAEIETILLHEKYHLENKDTLTMLLASITESLFPFFPIISDFIHNYQIEREVKADDAAIRTIGDDKPLLTVLEKLLQANHTAIAYAPAIGNIETLEPRIKAIAQKDFTFKRFRVINVMISIFSVAIIFGFIIAPVYAIDVHTTKGNNMMLCLSGGSCMTTACKDTPPIPHASLMNQETPATSSSHNYSSSL